MNELIEHVALLEEIDAAIRRLESRTAMEILEEIAEERRQKKLAELKIMKDRILDQEKMSQLR